MTLPAVTNADLARVLSPLERSVLVLAAKHGRDPERIAQMMEGSEIDEETLSIWSAFRAPPPAVIALALSEAERKVRELIASRGAEAPRRLPQGKPVTVRATLPRQPERRAVMPDPAPAPRETFAERVAREAYEEWETLRPRIEPLLVDAREIADVLTSLGQPLPQDLGALLDTKAPPTRTPRSRLPKPPAAVAEPPAAQEPTSAPPPPAETVPPAGPVASPEGAGTVPEELREMPAALRGGPLTTRLSAARKQKMIVDAVDAAGAEGQTVVPSEVSERLRGELSVDYVRYALRDLADASLILRTGKMRRGAGQTGGRTAHEYSSIVRKRVDPPAPSRPLVRISAQEESAIRDYAVSQKDGFTPAAAVSALRLSEETVRAGLQILIQREVITYVGMDDMELYEYVPPKRPAARPAAPRTRTNGSAPAVRREPVPGTGRDIQTPHKPTNELLRKARAAGAEVEKTGNGHFAIKNPETGRRVIMGSTQSSSSVAKTRKQLAAIGIKV